MKMKDDIKKKIRQAFKNQNIDLVTAPEEVILDTIKSVVGNAQLEAHRKEIVKIISHRNVSVNVNYKRCYMSSLNEDNTSWKKVEKSVTVKSKSGKVINATLSSTPVSDLGCFVHLESGKGINSYDQGNEHITNLWKAEAKSGDKVLFSGLRHSNTRGKESSSKEIVLAAAVQQYGLDKLQKSSESDVFEVRLGNIQLMSPGMIGDKDLSFKQIKTFKDIATKGPFQIDIRGKDGKPKKITLKLIKPILVNFGTNIQHYMLKGALIKSSYKQNKEAFIQLFGEKAVKKGIFDKESLDGEVGQYLHSLKAEICKINLTDVQKSVSDDKMKQGKMKDIELKTQKIINLSTQILDIWFTTKGKGKKSNPAAIQVRLAALMYLIGYPVSFNCKSGKDRTGEVAAEINDLMLTMESNNGDVPDPYAELSDDEKLQASDIFDATQSDKLAQSNSGQRGLKVKSKDTTDRLGKMAGASKHAKI